MTIRVDGGDMAEWCALLRDDNAIHLSRAAAAAAGFGPRRVNPGPANLAWLVSAALRADPGADFASIAAQFHGNALEDDLLTVSGDGTALCRGDETLLTATFTLRKDPP